MLHLKRVPVVPPAWWDSLAGILSFSQRQSRLFWSALAQSTAPELKALKYKCVAHEDYLRQQRLDLLQDGARLNDFLRQVWCPRAMVMALEKLEKQGLLSRADCRLFEQKFLVRTDRDGRWTTS